MTRSRCFTTIAVLAVASAAMIAGAGAKAPAPLAPYQMVRSLQLVQDRIADGDQAALPMQRKILELIDARLAESTAEDFRDARNFRALMIYAISGGNPATVHKIVSKLVLSDQDARLSAGVIEYVRGRPGRAVSALRQIDPRRASADIAASLALVKGTLFASIDPGQSLALLDFARLAGPGTLVEEAALRRSMQLSVEVSDADRFLRISEQYVRRFLRSPYASQFADSFVSGVAALHDKLDLERVAETIAGMNAEQIKVVYLRIARQASIERLSNLLEFAKKGLAEAVPDGSDPDPRAALYSALSSIATDDVAEVRGQLEAVDGSRLSTSDQELLEAAKSLIDEIVSPPRIASIGSRQPNDGGEGTSTLRSGAGAPAASAVDAAPALAAEGTVARAPGSTSSERQGPAVEPSSDVVIKARERIEAIDKMLREN